MALSRQLLTIALAIFIGTAACHQRPEDDLHSSDKTTTAYPSRASDDPMLQEQRRLASEIAALEKQQSVLAEQMSEQKLAIEGSERRIHDLKRDLEHNKAQTSAYIDQHQLQVACAFARQVARGEGEYSEKTKNCARRASIYCGLAMLNPTFQRKVGLAKQHVDKAEADAQSLKKQISSEEQKVKAEKVKLQETLESTERIAGDIAALRQKQHLPDGLDGKFVPLPTSQSR